MMTREHDERRGRVGAARSKGARVICSSGSVRRTIGRTRRVAHRADHGQFRPAVLTRAGGAQGDRVWTPEEADLSACLSDESYRTVEVTPVWAGVGPLRWCARTPFALDRARLMGMARLIERLPPGATAGRACRDDRQPDRDGHPHWGMPGHRFHGSVRGWRVWRCVGRQRVIGACHGHSVPSDRPLSAGPSSGAARRRRGASRSGQRARVGRSGYRRHRSRDRRPALVQPS